MKRLLLLLIAALVVTANPAQTRAQGAALPHIQAMQPSPAATPTAWMAVLVCMTVIALGVLVAAARLSKYRRSSAAREAEIVQEWAVGAAVARKRMACSPQAAVHSRPEPKVNTAKRPTSVPRTADCYWTYQSRQPG